MGDGRLTQLLDEALGQIGDPARGLPDPAFAFALEIVPMINVDLLVRDDRGRTLLAWREDAFGRGWHIPGGIIRRDETFADRIRAVADGELGLDVEHEAQPSFVLDVGRRYGRGHFVSLLFHCTPKSSFRRPGLFGDEKLPLPEQLAWFAGAPVDLYPVHREYPAWIWQEIRT